MDASTEFNKEQTIPDNKITTIINIKFSVALYVITPSVAEKSVAAGFHQVRYDSGVYGTCAGSGIA